MKFPDGWADMLADMRKFAELGGIGFFPIQSKSRGSIPIWIEDINKCAADEELVALILKCISE